MRKVQGLVFFMLLAVFISCRSDPGIISLVNPSPAETIQRPEIHSMEDYRGKYEGESIPEWVRLYLESGNQGVEFMGVFQEHYAFVARNSGSNFTALNHWLEGFSPELDFPRLAAARIEARFLMESPLPDIVFGTFYINLIRAASDHNWRGPLVYDHFWMLSRPGPQEPAAWEFLILCIMPRNLFLAQYNYIYNNVNSRSAPTWEEQRALNRLANRFSDGF